MFFFYLLKYLHSDEIGLIPCPEARYNRSPIVLVENKLGVESWCVKFLLPYVHNKLLLYRQRKQWLDREGRTKVYCVRLCQPAHIGVTLVFIKRWLFLQQFRPASVAEKLISFSFSSSTGRYNLHIASLKPRFYHCVECQVHFHCISCLCYLKKKKHYQTNP